ncbi:hypothetical protein B0O99DRAFT_641127 [Bisporella sp. PMI_857]|nr:hypothetical protein B0O99DRAFT_641127 [Bisporella sp. PMI_857]
MDAVLLGDVLSKWPGRCTWPGCESEAFLKTRKLLETHVYNLHVNPLMCDVPGCTYRKAFAKLGDLERHKATRHERAGRFKCPDATCPRHIQGFSRKDKLKAHSKSHAPKILYCQFNHCEFYVNAERRKRFRSNNEHSIHQASHGLYECAVGGCEGSSSSFTLDGLIQHLNRRHWWRFYIRLNKDNFAKGLQASLVLDDTGYKKMVATHAPSWFPTLNYLGHCSSCHRQSQRAGALLMPPPDESENIHA